MADHSFFDDFFGSADAHKDARDAECCKCGALENLTRYGQDLWICSHCRSEADAEMARMAAENGRIVSELVAQSEDE